MVGWATRGSIQRELVLDAVLMATRRRHPQEALIHSDQGSQYGSDAWRRFCKSNHLKPSMSRRGNCWDNAVAESFFGSLKKELIKKHISTRTYRASALMTLRPTSSSKAKVSTKSGELHSSTRHPIHSHHTNGAGLLGILHRQFRLILFPINWRRWHSPTKYGWLYSYANAWRLLVAISRRVFDENLWRILSEYSVVTEFAVHQ